MVIIYCLNSYLKLCDIISFINTVFILFFRNISVIMYIKKKTFFYQNNDFFLNYLPSLMENNKHL